MTLEIRLLGDFSLKHDGVELYDVHRIRLRSFLAYLAIHTTAPLLRQQVAFAFWPDSSEGQARNNLRKSLYDLRQALTLTESFLHIDESSE
jgi:DNA-binding SARP family transcriptional activator